MDVCHASQAVNLYQCTYSILSSIPLVSCYVSRPFVLEKSVLMSTESVSSPGYYVLLVQWPCLDGIASSPTRARSAQRRQRLTCSIPHLALCVRNSWIQGQGSPFQRLGQVAAGGGARDGRQRLVAPKEFTQAQGPDPNLLAQSSSDHASTDCKDPFSASVLHCVH